MKWLAPLACLVGATVAQAQLQHVLSGTERLHTGIANYTGLGLSAIAQQDAYVALTHPRFPAYQVRVKKTEFCDPTVKCVSIARHLGRSYRSISSAHLITRAAYTQAIWMSIMARNTCSSTFSKAAEIQRMVRRDVR